VVVARSNLPLIYFYTCNIFGDVWHLIHHWLGVCSVLPYDPVEYLIQFRSVGGNCSMVRQLILHLIWFATKWKIWKERNSRLFNDKVCPTHQIVDKIKYLSFMWLKAKLPNLAVNYHGWWLNPATMLGIG